MSRIEKDEQFKGTQSGKGHSVSSTVQPDGEEGMSPTVEIGEKRQRKGISP